MLDRVSNQNKISLFDVLAAKQNAPTRSNEDKSPKTDWAGEASNRTPEMKSALHKQKEEEKNASKQNLFDIENQKERKLSHNTSDTDKNDLSRGSKSIRSSRSGGEELVSEGGISDMRGSGKDTKLSHCNSVFNPNAIIDSINAKSQKEINSERNAKLAKAKEKAEDNYRKSQMPELSSDDYAFGNPSSIIPAKSASGNKDPLNGKVPSRNISMFDSMDFERLQPTSGEQMEKKSKKTDESWKNVSKTRNTRDISNEMFDKMSSQKSSQEIDQIMKNGNPRHNSNAIFDKLIDIMNKKEGNG